ncbi:MAG: nickel-dependent hydrogenase large subunit [Dissulfurispiraceae bacterium]|jgi:hydrogenase large subunit
MAPQRINVSMNRVEGDLEVNVDIDDGVVTDAWCSGTMYRGFEKILVGRGSYDGLVITPRICGICSTSHLVAASRALDMVTGVTVPPDAVRVRNIAQMAEHIQSDVRHYILMFAVDFANPAYKDHPLFEEAVRRYEPFKGKSVSEAIRQTKKVLEIIAIIGGQWPHSSFMVPGGIASIPSKSDLLQCGLLLRQYRTWYEQRILGCSIERWREIRSAGDLDAWLEERPEHRDSDLGFYLRFARSIGLDKTGKGVGAFLSFGALELPEGTTVRGGGTNSLIPAGFANAGRINGFDQAKVAEHVASSWYMDYEGGKHPYQGETQPYATGKENNKYSWAKAPRYDDCPVETGPLAEMVIAGNPLIAGMIGSEGPSTYLRELARLVRPVELIPAMESWLKEGNVNSKYYTLPGEARNGEGFGLTQASRGALGHWLKIENDVIRHYQIITPSAWNFSPRDSRGKRGPVEEALSGTRVKDMANPVELGHVVRSFDACLVCTVHTARRDEGHRY